MTSTALSILDTQTLRSVHFHGALADRFGPGPHSWAADDFSGCIRGMEFKFGPAFREVIFDYRWRIVRGPEVDIETRAHDIPAEQLTWNLGSTTDIHLIPSAEGSKSYLTDIVAIVIIAIGAYTGNVYLVEMGAVMLIGGVIQELNKPANTNQNGVGGTQASSLFFTGAQNVTTQGGPVPIVYGECLAGSVVLSVDETVAQITPDSGSINTVKSQTTFSIVEAISEGPILGFVNGNTYPAQSIFLSTTPMMDTANGAGNLGNYNFPSVSVQYREGDASQTVMNGFGNAAGTYVPNVKILQASPYVYATTASNINQVRVTLSFPSGLFLIDAGSGQYRLNSVAITIATKLSTGSTYTTVLTDLVSQVTPTAWQKQYLINYPGVGAPTTTWDIKVSRNTPDNASVQSASDVYFYSSTELQNANLPYNNTAVVGLTWAATSANQQLDPRAYWVYGKTVLVPDNYNPTTRTYSGTWDGLFSSTKQYTNNPVWCLLDLLIAPVNAPNLSTGVSVGYGLGRTIAQIDTSTFYNAATYCDAYISNGLGGTEPRFTLNTQFLARDDAWKFLQSLCATFRGMLWEVNGVITMTIDAPANVAWVINKSNVSEDSGVGFNYVSSTGLTRYNGCNVTFNDPGNYYQPKTVSYCDNTQIVPPGKPATWTSITLLGCTSEGQANRYARWVVDTSCYATKTVNFSVSLPGMKYRVGDIIKIFDPNLAGQRQDGRVKSVSGTTVVLDKTVIVSAGSTISCLLADGVTLQQKTITNSAGSYSTVTVSSSFTQAVTDGAAFIVEGAVVATLWRITGIAQNSSNPILYDISALAYDPNRYSRIETGVSVPAAPYTVQMSGSQPGIPTSMVFTLQGRNYQGTVAHDLFVSWTPPTAGATVDHYLLSYQPSGSSSWVRVQTTNNIPSYLISNVGLGLYNVQVQAVSTSGVNSVSLVSSYTVTLTGLTSSALSPPTSLVCVAGGTTFYTQDLAVQFTNPTTNNATIGATLLKFVVQVWVGGIQKNTYYVPSVAPGGVAYFTYTYTMNQADNGNVPSRTIQLKVFAMDTTSNMSASGTTVTFTNPAPAAPLGVSIIGSYQCVFVNYTTPTDLDYVGSLIWRSTTSGFTPSAANKVYAGTDTNFVDQNLSASATSYYYRIAAYDTFYLPASDSFAGTGLTLSSEYTTTTVALANFNEYSFTGLLFQPNSPTANSVSWGAGTAYKSGGATGVGSTWAISAGNAAWTTGHLYIYYVEGNTTLSTTTNLVTAVGASQEIIATYNGGNDITVGMGKAYLDGANIIANTVGANQVVTSGLITNSAQIGNAVVSLANINTATITTLSGLSANIGTITAGTLTAVTINSSVLNSATINAGQIMGGSFTGYAWPGSGSGFYLGPSGLLLGNYYGGQWFAVDSAGDFSGPGIASSGGNIVFTGALSGATGTFSGGLTASAINAVNTININGNAITIPVQSYTAASRLIPTATTLALNAVAVTIPATAPTTPIVVTISCLYKANYVLGSNSTYQVFAVNSWIQENGIYTYTALVSNAGSGFIDVGNFVPYSATVIATPLGAGTYTFTFIMSNCTVTNTCIIAFAAMR
jgi:predicted phage tail protein